MSVKPKKKMEEMMSRPARGFAVRARLLIGKKRLKTERSFIFWTE
jgi:hypothetical protein